MTGRDKRQFDSIQKRRRKRTRRDDEEEDRAEDEGSRGEKGKTELDVMKWGKKTEMEQEVADKEEKKKPCWCGEIRQILKMAFLRS